MFNIDMNDRIQMQLRESGSHQSDRLVHEISKLEEWQNSSVA